jgi:hypothetical protein
LLTDLTDEVKSTRSEFKIRQQNILNNKYLRENFDTLNYKKDYNNQKNYIQTSYLDTYQKELNLFEKDLIENIEKQKDFDIIEFLNPKEGSKDWLKKQTEIIQLLIEEKKFKEVSEKLIFIKSMNEVNDLNYESQLLIDDVYNFLIEKLCNSFNVKFINLYN